MLWNGIGETKPVLDNVAAVSTGGMGSYAIRTDGTLWVWGWQSGHGVIPQKVDLPFKVIAVHSYEDSVFILSQNGRLYSWGSERAALGREADGNHAKPGFVMECLH
jgi:alpha-tubulin suppressor-like RCC1 family protein